MNYKSIMLSFLMALLIVFQLYAVDWHYWRGPDRNGISPETDWDPMALNNTNLVKWKIRIGIGYSSVSVKGEYLYTMGYKQGKNVILCLDKETGETVWTRSYRSSPGEYKGPKCTPVVDGQYVYTLGQDGQLLCHNAETGKKKWKTHLNKDLGATPPNWGFASSVCIEDNMILVNAGRSGIALDKNTGEKIWSSAPGTGNYSTPVTYTFNNKLHTAIFGMKKLFGVDASTGEVQWSFPWETSYDVMAADPIIIGNKVFISSGYNRGSSLWDFSGNDLKKVWENKSISTHFSSTLLMDNYIYGIDGNTGRGYLKCIDPNTGEVQWSRNVGFGSLIGTKNKYLIVLNEKGTLYTVKADAQSYKEISKKEGLLSRLCWTPPVLSNGMLYIRNDKGQLGCLDMTKK